MCRSLARSPVGRIPARTVRACHHRHPPPRDPVNGEALALPTDRVRIPTERELFLFGEVAGSPSVAAGEVARQDFSSSYGYVME